MTAPKVWCRNEILDADDISVEGDLGPSKK